MQKETGEHFNFWFLFFYSRFFLLTGRSLGARELATSSIYNDAILQISNFTILYSMFTGLVRSHRSSSAPGHWPSAFKCSGSFLGLSPAYAYKCSYAIHGAQRSGRRLNSSSIRALWAPKFSFGKQKLPIPQKAQTWVIGEPVKVAMDCKYWRVRFISLSRNSPSKPISIRNNVKFTFWTLNIGQ